MDDLKILSREGVEVGPLTVRPLPRAYSQPWRAALVRRLEPVLQLSKGELFSAQGDVDIAMVERIVQQFMIALPDAVSDLVALWVWCQRQSTSEFVPICREEVERTRDDLGLLLTEQDEQAVLELCLGWCFPLARLRELSGLAQFLRKISTRETASVASSETS